MSSHAFHFYGPITPKSFENLRAQILTAIQQQGAEEIILYLSSEGGNLTAGFTAYNFLKALPIPVSAINMGTIESIAVILYLSAEKRLAIDNSRFLLHSFNWTFNTSVIDHARLAEHSLSLEFDFQRYINIFNQRTQGADISVDISKCLNGNARILDTTTAAANIIHGTIPPEGAIRADCIHWWPNICV